LVKPLNLCGACRRDFTSLELFDAHRVGVHAYTYSGGLAMEPMREDGRRCLDPAAMTERGWVQDLPGRWLNPARANRARRLSEVA
jgi:hypothetical protein